MGETHKDQETHESYKTPEPLSNILHKQYTVASDWKNILLEMSARHEVNAGDGDSVTCCLCQCVLWVMLMSLYHPRFCE